MSDLSRMRERDADLALAELEYNSDLERLMDQMRLAGKRHARRVADIHHRFRTAKDREAVDAKGGMDCASRLAAPKSDQS